MESGSLEGRRVLVVEDEFLIAHDLKRALIALDADVIGPVSSLSAGMALVDSERPDAVVLDLNLCGQLSYPLADRLRDADIPTLFVTGYDEWALPEDYLGTPRITKPFENAEVTSVIARLCSPGGAS